MPEAENAPVEGNNMLTSSEIAALEKCGFFDDGSCPPDFFTYAFGKGYEITPGLRSLLRVVITKRRKGKVNCYYRFMAQRRTDGESLIYKRFVKKFSSVADALAYLGFTDHAEIPASVLSPEGSC